MCLPNPGYSFTIPSVYDDTTLDCRLYHPKQHHDSDPLHPTKAAIIAHPYAPLGGCYDDPVVASMGKALLNAGYIVGTFNFRYFSKQEHCTIFENQHETCMPPDTTSTLLCSDASLLRLQTSYIDCSDYVLEALEDPRAALPGLQNQN
jgi:hypothetical protein